MSIEQQIYQELVLLIGMEPDRLFADVHVLRDNGTFHDEDCFRVFTNKANCVKVTAYRDEDQNGHTVTLYSYFDESEFMERYTPISEQAFLELIQSLK